MLFLVLFLVTGTNKR